MHAMPKGLNGIKLDLNESDMNDCPETDGFRSFAEYLLNKYLLQDSKFSFHQWNYNDSIQNGDMGITTNPLENNNLKLKSKMGHGYLAQKSAFKKPDTSLSNWWQQSLEWEILSKSLVIP